MQEALQQLAVDSAFVDCLAPLWARPNSRTLAELGGAVLKMISAMTQAPDHNEAAHHHACMRPLCGVLLSLTFSSLSCKTDLWVTVMQVAHAIAAATLAEMVPAGESVLLMDRCLSEDMTEASKSLAGRCSLYVNSKFWEYVHPSECLLSAVTLLVSLTLSKPAD